MQNTLTRRDEKILQSFLDRLGSTNKVFAAYLLGVQTIGIIEQTGKNILKPGSMKAASRLINFSAENGCAEANLLLAQFHKYGLPPVFKQSESLSDKFLKEAKALGCDKAAAVLGIQLVLNAINAFYNDQPAYTMCENALFSLENISHDADFKDETIHLAAISTGYLLKELKEFQQRWNNTLIIHQSYLKQNFSSPSIMRVNERLSELILRTESILSSWPKHIQIWINTMDFDEINDRLAGQSAKSSNDLM